MAEALPGVDNVSIGAKVDKKISSLPMNLETCLHLGTITNREVIFNPEVEGGGTFLPQIETKGTDSNKMVPNHVSYYLKT